MNHLPCNPATLRQQAEQLATAGNALLAASQQLRCAANFMAGLHHTNGQPTTPSTEPARKGTQLKYLRDWLAQHGPLRRKTVLANCGLTRNTANVYLSKQNGFHQDEYGRWFVPTDQAPTSQPDAETNGS